MADMWGSAREQFLITPTMKYTSSPEEFVATGTPVQEGNGIAVTSFHVKPGLYVAVQRSYTVGGRTWVSANGCQFDN
jgi:hypothetical protein